MNILPAVRGLGTTSVMEAGFEFFDHTADLGIRAWAPTPNGVVDQASKAFYAVIGELVTGSELAEYSCEVSGGDRAELLRDYLTELLVFFEQDLRVVRKIDLVCFDGGRLKVVGWSASVDMEASALAREVKAVTYHELAFQEVEGGYEAAFIVDI